MNIWKLFIDLIEAEHHQTRVLVDLICEQKDLKHQVQAQGELLKQIHQAVVPAPVVKIQLSTETGEHMDIKVGQSSTLSAVFKDKDGNVTVPVNTPQFNASDQSNFSLDTATGVLSAIGSAGATDDVNVSVLNADGSTVTSNVVSYTIVADQPPGPNPVASIELTGSTPA